MELTRRSLLSGIAVGGISLSFAGIASADGTTRYIAATRGRGVANRIEAAGFDIQNKLADGDVLVVSGPDDNTDVLNAIRGVSRAIPDFAIEREEPVALETYPEGSHDDAQFWELQWDKHVTDVEPALDVATGAGTSIAILDTGIDETHPDLQNLNVADSGVVYGGEIHPHTGDINGHGTHVGGIAAATGSVGVIGTAPDAELISLRVFTTEDEEQDDFWSDLLLAIDHAATELGVDALNMSIGTVDTLDGPVNAGGIRGVTEPVMQHATRLGTVIVGSAGNHGESLQIGGAWTLPNSLAGVMSISATAPNDTLSFYSNYGTNEIDVGAPGGGYETLEKTLEEDPTVVDWPFPSNLVLNAYYDPVDDVSLWAWLAGTSMAAPQVAGLVCLVRELAPGASANHVEQSIKHGAEGVRGRGSPEFGAGRINALHTVERVS